MRVMSVAATVNRRLVSGAAALFSGVKQSGFEREGSHHGVLEFMDANIPPPADNLMIAEAGTKT